MRPCSLQADEKPGATAAPVSGAARQACPADAGQARGLRLSASLAREEKELLRDAQARSITELLGKWF